MLDKIDKDRLNKELLAMKLKALEMAASTGSNGAHIGGGFSAMEIMAVLLDSANLQPDDFKKRDRIILSKGHGSLALFTGLWQKGFITDEEIATFDNNGSEFFAHPHRNISKGIDFSGGSLGLGISYAIGVALACKMNNRTNRVFAILGDGECDEGIVWEALMSASHYDLDNLTVIVDNNGLQVDGNNKDVMNLEDLNLKFSAFGFHCITVDGHNIEELASAFLNKAVNKPLAIIARTRKANGISFLENTKQSHHCSLTSKKYQQAVSEIKEAYGVE